MKRILLRTILFNGILLLLLPTVFSQTTSEKSRIVQETNVRELNAFAKESSEAYEANRSKAIKLANENDWIIRKEFDNKVIELQGVTEDGRPLYYITHNEDAAGTVSTDEVQPGGSAGLSLDGTGMVAGEWDGGDVRTTHQEFNNTGSSRVTDMDGSTGISNHATHVAGTIIAGGVSTGAEGMAFNADLNAYDWASDFSEMANAASGGLLLSNHSYGYVTGWNWDGSQWVWHGDTGVSTDEDYRFGFYGIWSQQDDQIAYDAPYYLICKSAGNDRGDGPSSGPYPQDGAPNGYDCIGWRGNAKNILTIGATQDLPGG